MPFGSMSTALCYEVNLHLAEPRSNYLGRLPPDEERQMAEAPPPGATPPKGNICKLTKGTIPRT